MNSLIYQLDLFKKPLTLLISTREKQYTILGSLISLGIITFLLYIFGNSDLFQKLKPNVTIQSVADELRPKITFTKKNMSLALRVDDYNTLVYNDSSYFQVYSLVQRMKIDTSEVIYEKKELMKNCEISDFQDPKEYSILNLYKGFCLNDPYFELEGFWDQQYISFVKFELHFCNNITMNNTCKSDEEIKRFMKDKNFNLFFPDNNYDLNNYKNPIKIFYQNKYHLIDPNVKKSQTFYFKKVAFVSDEGFFFEENPANFSFVLDKEESDFRFDTSEGIISEFYLFTSLETLMLVRRYQKIQEVLANLGGIASFLMVIGYILTGNYQEFIMVKQVMNRLYSFQSEIRKKKNSNNDPNNKSPEHNIELISKETKNLDINQLNQMVPSCENMNIAIQNSIVNTPMETSPKSEKKVEFEKFPAKNINDEEKFVLENFSKQNFDFVKIENTIEIPSNQNSKSKISQSIKRKISKKQTGKDSERFENFEKEISKTHELKLTYFQFLYGTIIEKLCCKKRSFKSKLFEKAKTIFLEEMDIIEILQKMKEFEKLKSIVLSPEQLNLFSMLSKPMIYLEKETEDSKRSSFLLSEIMNSKKKDHVKMVEYYSLLKSKATINDIDQRLLNLLEENIKEMMKNKQEN